MADKKLDDAQVRDAVRLVYVDGVRATKVAAYYGVSECLLYRRMRRLRGGK